MRTRIYNKCTNDEIEAYLNRGGNTMIIAVGTVELHGQLPLDCETIVSEAVALRIAEMTDSLAVINLPFFCAGSTSIGRGTFNISVEEGIRYLKSVVRSFYRQGFRRMMLISDHGPAYLTCNTVCMDFFHETKDPIIHCDVMHAMDIAKEKGWQCAEGMEGHNQLMYGAYKIMNQLEYIPVITDFDDEALLEQRRIGDKKQEFKNDLHRLAPAPGLFGSYYYTREQHGGLEYSRTKEEREQRGEEGERILTEMVRCFDPQHYLDLLKELDDQVNEEILPMYPHVNHPM